MTLTVAVTVAEAIRSGARRPLSRAITALERDPAGQADLLAELWAFGGQAQVIGITGPPGAGKSTLIARMAADYHGQGLSVAVLAVDPSSVQGTGAILGDRLRMQSLSDLPGVYIRSMSSRGAFGGLSAATADAITLLDAAGFARILVESVGVGQSETDIAAICGAVVVLHSAAAGDVIQAIKSGITEIASLHLINRPGIGDVAALTRALREAVSLRHMTQPDAPVPQVVQADPVGGGDMSRFYSALETWFSSGAAAHGAEARIRARAVLDLRRRMDSRLQTAASVPAEQALIAQITRRERPPAALSTYWLSGGSAP